MALSRYNEIMLCAKIDKRLKLPYYQQIATSIEKAIKDGLLKDGDLLPKNKEIATYFDISEIVARQAYDVLEAKGLIIRIQGKGTFVKYRPVITIPAESLYDTAAVFKALGHAYDRALKMIDDDEGVLKLRTIDTVDGYPISHQTWWIYEEAETIIRAIQFQDGTFSTYKKAVNRPLDRLENQFIPRSADDMDALILGIREGTPVYFIRSRIYDADNTCMLKAESVFTAEYLKFEVEK